MNEQQVTSSAFFNEMEKIAFFGKTMDAVKALNATMSLYKQNPQLKTIMKQFVTDLPSIAKSPAAYRIPEMTTKNIEQVVKANPALVDDLMAHLSFWIK